MRSLPHTEFVVLVEVEHAELEITSSRVLKVRVCEGLIHIKYQCFLTYILLILIR